MSEDPKTDLDAWEPQLPPSDFAERVLAQVRAEAPANAMAPTVAKGRARRWGLAAGVTGALALAAALAFRIGTAPDAHGEAIAKDRLEVSIGTRARAVLEPGAQVKWDGDDVVQAHGDVFYRVEPGARFRVHTPAGDVEVKGTCFAVKIRGEGDAMDKRDVKSGVIGAALSALAFVAVYEGKVAVSHAGGRIDLGAGESAQAGSDGVHAAGKVGDGEKAFDAKAASAASADVPLVQANDNLVAQVSEYRARLEVIASQKADLEQKLKKSEEKLASADGGSRSRAEFDLTQEDWADLAKKGTVKYLVPCEDKERWAFSPEKLNKLGLAPQDGKTLRDAYERSYQRVWAQIKPLCVQAIGSAETAEKIGMTCPFIIRDVAAAIDREATAEAQTQAAEIRAGLRPEPGPNDKVHPVTKMFLILSGANKAFESDLAAALGPDEAHRLAMSDDMCSHHSTWGGGKKREDGAGK